MNRLRRHGLSVILVLTGLAIVLFARGLTDQQNRIERIVATEHLQIVEGCQRLNILRAEDNRSHYADYRVFSLVYRETLVARSLYRTPQEKAYFLAFTREMRGAIADKTWTPLTDCTQAVNAHGAAYPPPNPIPFNTRLPSADALGQP